MENTYWLRQRHAEPLFPDLLWSRPENKISAGKLLIIGGNSHEFADVSTAYEAAQVAGAGSTRVLLPASLRKTLEKALPNSDFLPATKSGNIAQVGLSDLLEHVAWADCVLFPGELGRNSETSILLEKFLDKTSKQVVLAKDAVDVVLKLSTTTSSHDDIVLVLTIAQLQTLAKHLQHSSPVTYGMNALQLAEFLHEFSTKHKAKIVIKHQGNIFVAVGGRVSSTPSNDTSDDMWRVETAARAAVWWMQSPAKPLEAITTSIIQK